jgi:hypothetical protein
MAVSQWKLTRMELGEINIFKDPAGPEKQIPLLDRLWQAECRLERSYARAQRELQRLQNSRPQPDPQPEEPVPASQPEPESRAAEVGQALSPVSSTSEIDSNIHPPTSDTLTPKTNGFTVTPPCDPAIRFQR